MAFWNWFQRSADRINKLDWSPSMKVKIQKINDRIPAAITEAIFKYIETTYKVTSRKLAEKALRNITNTLKEIIDEKR